MTTTQRDLLLYTLHRFAVAAAGQRLTFNTQVLNEALNEASIDSFRALIDLDEPKRRQIGLKVIEKLKPERGGWLGRPTTPAGRLRPSMR